MAVVAGLTALSGVSLFSNQLTSIAPLSTLTELRYISIDNNAITDLSVAANWTNLTWLDGSGLAITNVDSLQGLTALSTANLRGTATLTSLTGLLNNSGFGSGDTLDVTNTGVSCTDVATLEANGVTVTSSCQQ